MADRQAERCDPRSERWTDCDLMRRVRQGDVAAFERLVHLHWDDLVGYAESMAPDRDAAKDAVQETLARLWERRAEWRDGRPVRMYLFRAVRNRIIDGHRKLRVWDRWSARWRQELRRAPRAPDTIAEQTELAATLERAIAALPERRREVFVLAHLQNFTYQEIAELLDLSPQTVANHVSLALRDLRVTLGPHFAGEPAEVGSESP